VMMPTDDELIRIHTEENNEAQWYSEFLCEWDLVVRGIL
jgi:hypothetical protein